MEPSNEIWQQTLTGMPLVVTGIIFFIGFLSTFLPILPGNAIVWLGILIHKLWVHENSVSWSVVIVTGILMIIAMLLDWVCTLWGARKFGASWRGALGALIGGFVGIFTPPPLVWVILGPVIGAVIAELLSGRALREATKAGIGTIIGSFISFLLKITIASFSIGLFYYEILNTL
jgi:uncharacterized protein